MSSNSLFKSPVIINKVNEKLKLFHLDFKTDGSIHVFFATPKKYVVTMESKEKNLKPGKNIINMETPPSYVGKPYVSFHPGKGVVHVNTHGSKNPYITDVPVKNLGRGVGLFGICRVVLSDSNFLSHYTKRPDHKHPLVINELNNKNHLIFEVFAHRADKTPEVNNLPHAISTGITTLQDKMLKAYSASINMYEVGKNDRAFSDGLDIMVNGQNGLIAFKMSSN